MTIRRPRATDLALLGVVALILVAIGLGTQLQRASTLDERARNLAGELRCPVCQGLSIADSPAPLAEQMRRIVWEQLAAGATDEDVRDFFVARYGTWILLAPPAEGRDLLLWLAPGVFVLLGLIAVALRSRSHTHGGPRIRTAGLGRLGTLALTAGIVGGVGLPLLLAVGARTGNQEITGFFPGRGSAPSLADLEARLAAEPTEVSSLLALADVYVLAGRLDEGAALYRRALQQEPESVRAWVGIGVILVFADRPDAAAVAFDRAIAVAPDDPDALFYRALARARLAGAGSPAVRADAERFLAVAPYDPRADMARRLLAPAASGAP